MTDVARTDGRLRDTRVRIRSAAIDLFSDQGFAATSVREITAACSVTPGALYNHYRSKEDILADVFRETRAHLQALIERAMTSGGTSAARRLALLALALTWYHAEHRRQAMVVLNEHPWLPDDDQQELLTWHRAIRRTLEVVLRDGIDRGEMSVPAGADLPTAVAVTAKALLGMWTGVGVWYRAGGSATSGEVALLYARLALQSVAAPAQDEALAAFPLS